MRAEILIQRQGQRIVDGAIAIHVEPLTIGKHPHVADLKERAGELHRRRRGGRSGGRRFRNLL